MRLTIKIFCTFVMSVSAFANVKAADIFVYRNSSNTEKIDIEDLRHIFNGDRLAWNNSKVIRLYVNDLEKINERDFENFSGLTKAEFMDLWRIKFFSGRSGVPIQVKRQQKVLDSLEDNSAALYISFESIPISGEIKETKISF